MIKNKMTSAEMVGTDDFTEVDWLADLGEIVGPVTHEFNNFLNTLLLQVAVMEMSAPAELKAELATIRRHGREVTAVVKQLQRFSRRRPAESKPADLSRAAAVAASALVRRPNGTDGGPRLRLAGSDVEPEPGDVVLRLQLAEGLPLAIAGAADLRRLCRFLTAGLTWAVAGGGELTLTTEMSAKGLALRLKVGGAAPGSLAQMLEGPASQEGPHGLELAACQSLVRRLNGSLRTETGPGVESVVVELPAVRA